MWRAAYFEEITQGLRRLGALTVVVLAASKTTLLQRIEADEESGARPWRLAHLDVGLQALKTISSNAVLSTDHLRPDEVAEQILALLELGER